MSTRWTGEDIKQKGLKINGQALPAVRQSTQPALFALGRLPGGNMNKTEIHYRDMLELKKYAGEVIWWAFEPLNLRIGANCFYSVDFLVMLKTGELECHEIKGGHITDDALVKFKAAAAMFPFKFRMIALVKGEWIERHVI